MNQIKHFTQIINLTSETHSTDKIGSKADGSYFGRGL